ncbi:MAG: glycosyltransferase family 2 protein [Planctomycetota bacterium]
MAAINSEIDLSIVVLSWNTKDLTLACLESLFAEEPNFHREVIVVDNGSKDGSADAIAERFPEARLFRNEVNQGYSGGNNQGAREARGQFLCLLNSDTEVRPGALDRLVAWLRDNPNYGMAAPRLVYPDGRVQPACMRYPSLATALIFDSVLAKFWPGSWVESRYQMKDFDHLTSRDVQQPPGACCVTATEEYRALGGLDEDLWLFFNDVDLCRKLTKRSRKIRYVAESEVLHHEGASTKGFADFVVMWHRNRLHYYRKHFGGWSLPWVRFCVRFRAFEEWVRAGKRNRGNAEGKRAEREHLKQAVREILAPLDQGASA